MTLIESRPDETDGQLRAALDDILIHLWDEPKPGWWCPYEIRGAYRIRGVTFRQFYCVAGSVEALLFQRALKGLSRRVAVLPDPSCVCVPSLVEDGREIPIEPVEIVVA